MEEETTDDHFEQVWQSLSRDQQQARLLEYIEKGMPADVPEAQVFRTKIKEEMYSIC